MKLIDIPAEDIEIRLDLDGGKYTLVLFRDVRLLAFRHGEEWRDLVGDKLVLGLLNEAVLSAGKLLHAQTAVSRFINAQGAHLPPSWKTDLVENCGLMIDTVNPYQPVEPPPAPSSCTCGDRGCCHNCGSWVHGDKVGS